MSNFSETYFYSSVLDNGELNEYGCGIKNINNSKEYYIYDTDSKNYTTVDKEQYIDYNEKMEQMHGDTPPPSQLPSVKKCPLTREEQEQFKQSPVQSSPPSEECPCYTPPLPKKCPLTQQEQEQFKQRPVQPPLPSEECPFYTPPLPKKQFQQRPVQSPPPFEECQCLSQPQCCVQPLFRPPSQRCVRPLRQSPQLHLYPMGGYVKRIPVMNELDVLKRENQKLKSMMKYYTLYE